MRILCLTDRDPESALPALALLPHEVHAQPLAAPTQTQAFHHTQFDLDASPSRDFAVNLVDAGVNPRTAQLVCHELLERNGGDPPTLLITTESMLAAITPAWGVRDVLLPHASPAEIDLRLRLAVPPVRVEKHVAAPSNSAITIDEHTFTARVNGRPLDLTYKEFELLLFLADHPDRVFTREQLLHEVWATDYYGGSRTVDVHVRRLRAKLGEQESLIRTVRGVGYGFANERETENEGAI